MKQVYHCNHRITIGQDGDGVFFTDDQGDFIKECPVCKVELTLENVESESVWTEIETLSQQLKSKEEEFQEKVAHLLPLKDDIADIAQRIKEIVLGMGQTYENDLIKVVYVRASTSNSYNKKALMKLARTNKDVADCITVKPKTEYVRSPVIK